MLSRQTIEKLGKILNENYNLALSPKKLSQVAYNLVSFFDSLAKYNYEDKYENKNTSYKDLGR